MRSREISIVRRWSEKVARKYGSRLARNCFRASLKSSVTSSGKRRMLSIISQIVSSRESLVLDVLDREPVTPLVEFLDGIHIPRCGLTRQLQLDRCVCGDGLALPTFHDYDRTLGSIEEAVAHPFVPIMRGCFRGRPLGFPLTPFSYWPKLFRDNIVVLASIQRIERGQKQKWRDPAGDQVLPMQEPRPIERHALIYALPAGFVHPQSPLVGPNPALV